jgi:hypothetical protein
MDGNTAGFQSRWTAGARVNPPVARVPAFPVGSKSTLPDFTVEIAARVIRAFFIRKNWQPSENYFALLAITRPAKAAMMVLERLSQILRNENGRRSPAIVFRGDGTDAGRYCADKLQLGLMDKAEVRSINAIERDEPWAISFCLKTLGKHRGYYESREAPPVHPDDYKDPFADAYQRLQKRWEGLFEREKKDEAPERIN